MAASVRVEAAPSRSLMLLFCEEVFSSRPHNTGARMRACGANILAPGLPSSRLHRRLLSPAIGLWEVVSSYSSATASGFHGIPRIHTQLTNFLAKNWGDFGGRRMGSRSNRESKKILILSGQNLSGPKTRS